MYHTYKKKLFFIYLPLLWEHGNTHPLDPDVKSTMHPLTMKVAPQYVEVGRSLKLCSYSKHDNQHIDIVVHPSS